MKTPSPTIGPRSIAGTSDDALGIHLHRFQSHLEELSYAPSTIAAYGYCITELDSLMQKHGIALVELDERKAVELLGRSEQRTPRGKYAHFIVRRFVRFLMERGVVAMAVPSPDQSPYAILRRDYEAYLRRQRGLSESTIRACWRIADRFLAYCFDDRMGDLSTITPTDIAGFLHQLHAHNRLPRVKTTSTHLRQFCRYLFMVGKTETNLALGIPSVAQRYGSRLRRHLTPEQVESVLTAVRSDTPLGRRNYAMVLLLARLGLRAPEVIAMQMNDVDWRAGEIIVRGKGQRHDRLPLPPDVGEAMAQYIRIDRVSTSRVIFVTQRAPHRPFKDGQVLNAILKDALAKAGVQPPGPYVGSHMLRHSLATHLVQQGASLNEISEVLRHRSRASTMIYAKLDVEGLRSIAQSWPTAGGGQ